MIEADNEGEQEDQMDDAKRGADDADATGEDAFLDAYMEDRISGYGYEDYEPSCYDGTYSEE
jgi:hypothetical protein